MTALTRMGSLARFAVRRDRIALPAGVYVIVALVASTAYTFKKLYPTAASRASLAVTGEANPALRFLYGRLDGDSLGALTAWRYGVWAAIFGSLLTTFVVIRHTRSDEEAGRGELVGSAAVGRQAPLAAALLLAGTANVVIAGLSCVFLPISGLPAGGSVALGLAIGGCGLAFTGISAVAAQVVSGARPARGIALGVLAAAFMLRGAGDAAGAGGGLSWLTWTSPLGWVELTRPFGAVRWWVLALPVAVFLAGAGLAFGLAARRDVGAGFIAGRPGRPHASALLRDPFGLAWRLQWGSLAGYAAGYVVIFAASGAAAKGIGQLLGTSGKLEHMFTRLGGQTEIVNAYLASLMLLAGLVGAGYATASILRLRVEEAEDRAEMVLATAVGRIRWAMSHIVVAVAGAAVLLAVAGVATALGYAIATGAPGASAGVPVGPEVARLVGAGLAELPAVLAVAMVAALVFGLRSAWAVPVAWTAVGVVVLLALFGQVLRLPLGLMDLSPFTHTPRLPGATVHAAPLVWLCVVALAFCLAGLATLRRRDIG
jgi:ABC-2 type transport system permease protein